MVSGVGDFDRAAKDGELNGAVTQALAAQSKFMAPLTEGSDPREL